MLYGGNFGRTTYGGIVRRVTSAIGTAFHKGIGIILSLIKGKNVLLSKRNPAILKSNERASILKTRHGVSLGTSNRKSVNMGVAEKPVFIKSTANSAKIRSNLEVRVLKIKSKKNTLGTGNERVVTKSTSKANPSVL